MSEVKFIKTFSAWSENIEDAAAVANEEANEFIAKAMEEGFHASTVPLITRVDPRIGEGFYYTVTVTLHW